MFKRELLARQIVYCKHKYMQITINENIAISTYSNISQFFSSPNRLEIILKLN
jgi:hypothetical protein